MRGWVTWILVGIGLALAMLLATCLLGLARLSPALGRRMARSALAVVLLRRLLAIAAGLAYASRD